MRAEATRISVFTALAAHALCFTGLAAAYFLAGRGALVSDPERALRLLVVSEAPIVIGVFSYLRRDPNRCSFFKAAARGLLGLPVACVYGASKFDWQNMLSHTIYFVPADVADYLISAPCHGAVLGAWLGAWPMPLDWERPWQEWPISVTYGAVAGHLVGKVASLVLIVLHKRRVRAKAD